MPTANRPTINAVTSQSARVIGSLRARLLTSLVWKLWYSGFVGSVFGAISSLHAYINIFWKSSQTLRIQPLRSRGALTCWQQPGCPCRRRPNAQKLGVGGTAVDPRLQDRASSEIGVLNSTIGPSMRRKTAIATGLPQRAARQRFGSRRGVPPARASVMAAVAPTFA